MEFIVIIGLVFLWLLVCIVFAVIKVVEAAADFIVKLLGVRVEDDSQK